MQGQGRLQQMVERLGQETKVGQKNAIEKLRIANRAGGGGARAAVDD